MIHREPSWRQGRLSPFYYALVACCFSFGAESEDFWNDSSKVLLLGIERLAENDTREAIPLLQDVLRRDPNSRLAHAWLAQAFHVERRLDEAGRHYRALLTRDPATPIDAARREAVLRFAPRVAQVASDPFPLKDAVAVHHPDDPLIAYHFFWEDDIDFPADNDPCDHELVWVRYDPRSQRLTGFQTYFHGRILSSPDALAEAGKNSDRPRVFVQWGKHGSLPVGWETLRIQANAGDIERKYLNLEHPSMMLDYNRAAFEKLRGEGRQDSNHPRTRAWPVRFEGSWEDFVRFERELDLRSALANSGMMVISRWNNAALQQNLLAYNFRPKTEWPDIPERPGMLESQLERRVGASGEQLMTPTERVALRKAAGFSPDPFLSSLTSAVAPIRLQLPPMSLFLPETPRYPNLWLAAPAARFPAYLDFIRHIESELRGRSYETLEVGRSEGADLEFSVEHLEPWGNVHGLRHAHDLHVRIFWKRLEQAGKNRQELDDDGRKKAYWLAAASVHYEVEHAHPLHADVEICLHCGRTGEYASKVGNLVERVHDPLGVELFLEGRIHGREVRRLGGSKVPGLREIFILGDSDLLLSTPLRREMNTEAIALVFLR